MNINKINSQSLPSKSAIMKRRLIPLNEYKGPLLQLDLHEIDQINKLRKMISNLEIEYFDLSNYVMRNKFVSARLYDRLYTIKDMIVVLKENIRNIKKLKMQKLRENI